MPTIPEELAIALEHHQAGRLAAAEELYRQILVADPNQPDALHLLGVIALQVGRADVAVEYIGRAIAQNGAESSFYINLNKAFLAQNKILEAFACCRRAVELNPHAAETHFNLGNAFLMQGQPDDAIACYERALELKPDDAETHFNLGNALLMLGKLVEASEAFRRAVAIEPDYFEAHFNLGNAFQRLGRPVDAIACYRRALEIKPDYAEANLNLGNALQGQGRFDEAIACYRRVLELKPGNAQVQVNLANALQAQGKLDHAWVHCRRALKMQPELAEAHFSLGNVFLEQGKLDEATACFRRALEIKPAFALAHVNLGSVFQAQGLLAEAIAYYRRGLELKPDFATAHSNLVYALNFCSDFDASAIYQEHRHWNQQFAEPLAKTIQPHLNERSTDRRLRIGYVSPDFRSHVVGRFLLPLLERHDHKHFEIFCYASVLADDAITDRCRAAADAWRDVLGVSDEQLAQTIREDRIDILVDLTMHLANHRLLCFARKPAPVQICYLAYAGTTGLSAIDYRLTDPYLDPPGRLGLPGRLGPPGVDESVYSEESIRLPETYWCYQPMDRSPAVNSLPALETGHVTLGCLNNFCKVTPPTLATWITLLQAIPNARLLLHAHAGNHRDRVRNLFAERGVAPDRLSFADLLPPAEYLQLYHQIDVALDPFPYGGGTTTCDALWMGVPVVSLAGHTAVGRGGLSILSNAGLADLVSRDTDEYIRIAVELANDLPRLSQLRASLRERLQNSPLMDAPRFARNVEAAYREMWRRWCER